MSKVYQLTFSHFEGNTYVESPYTYDKIAGRVVVKVPQPRLLRHAEMLRQVLENTDDYFIWIIADGQDEMWGQFLNKYKLKEYIHFNMDKRTWNPNYISSSYRPRLRLVIMKGKKNAA